MTIINYTELRLKLKKFLDLVESTKEVIIIKRSSKSKGSVLISLEEYNSLRLYESVHQAKSNKLIDGKLKE